MAVSEIGSARDESGAPWAAGPARTVPTARSGVRAWTGDPARSARAVEKILLLRHDVVVGNDVESAVRVAGGIPTLGGGVRARRFSTGGVRTGHELAASRKAVRAVAAPGRIDA